MKIYIISQNRWQDADPFIVEREVERETALYFFTTENANYKKRFPKDEAYLTWADAHSALSEKSRRAIVCAEMSLWAARAEGEQIAALVDPT